MLLGCHDYFHRYRGFGDEEGVCRMRVYEPARPGEAPVVVCSDFPDSEATPVARVAEYLAAEVIDAWFRESLPDLPNPLIWIEHQTESSGHQESFHLVTFASYEACEVAAGGRRLGHTRRFRLDRAEVETLIGPL